MDGSPIIGKTPLDNLYLDCGWCYGGFKATPASGWCFAHTIANDAPARAQRGDSRSIASRAARTIDEKGGGAVRLMAHLTTASSCHARSPARTAARATQTEFTYGGDATCAVRRRSAARGGSLERVTSTCATTRAGHMTSCGSTRAGCRRWIGVRRNTLHRTTCLRVRRRRAPDPWQPDGDQRVTSNSARLAPAGASIARGPRAFASTAASCRATPATRSPRRCSPTVFASSGAASSITGRAASSAQGRRSRTRWCSSRRARAPSRICARRRSSSTTA